MEIWHSVKWVTMRNEGTFMTIFRLARSTIAVALCLTATAALAQKLKWTELTDPA